MSASRPYCLLLSFSSLPRPSKLAEAAATPQVRARWSLPGNSISHKLKSRRMASTLAWDAAIRRPYRSSNGSNRRSTSERLRLRGKPAHVVARNGVKLQWERDSREAFGSTQVPYRRRSCVLLYRKILFAACRSAYSGAATDPTACNRSAYQTPFCSVQHIYHNLAPV